MVKRNGIKIISKILSFTQYKESEGLIRYRYVIEYIIEGQTYQQQLLKTGFGKPVIGDEVKIICDRNDHNHIFENSFEELLGLIIKTLLAIGGVSLIIYFLIFVK